MLSTNKQDWSNFDQSAFAVDFSAMDWNSAFAKCNNSPNTWFYTFDSNMEALLGQHLPTVSLTKRQHKTRTPWITSVMAKSISKHGFYFRKFFHKKMPEIKAQFHIQFTTYQNFIVSLCRKSNSYYFINFFNQNLTNLWKIWVGMKNFILLKSKKSNNLISMSMVSPLIQKLWLFLFSHFLKDANRNSMFLSPASLKEV